MGWGGVGWGGVGWGGRGQPERTYLGFSNGGLTPRPPETALFIILLTITPLIFISNGTQRVNIKKWVVGDYRVQCLNSPGPFQPL